MDDRPLVERAKKGDETAFSELVREYHQRIYALTYRYAGNPDDAADLCQLVWIKVWKKIGMFKGRSNFYTWLYRVAVFVSLDYVRKKARLRESEFDDALELASLDGGRADSVRARPDHRAQMSEVQILFDEALEKLPAEHRMALILREVEGKSYDEIADIMKCRKGTVMSRLHYARKMVQTYLESVR